MPYFGHRHSHRYLPPSPPLRHGIRVAARVYHKATKFIPSRSRLLPKNAPHQPPNPRSEAPERSPKIRAQTAEIPKDPSSTVTPLPAVGGGGQGRRQRCVGAGGGGSGARERTGGGKDSMLRVCRIVHLPPHPSRVGGWMGGWLVPAPRTDQYLKHREVSSRYFRCTSATGNEGVKNILQIASAGIIPFTVQVPPIATRGPICGTRDVSRRIARSESKSG
jgi:hypothetical protein